METFVECKKVFFILPIPVFHKRNAFGFRGRNTLQSSRDNRLVRNKHDGFKTVREHQTIQSPIKSLLPTSVKPTPQ